MDFNDFVKEIKHYIGRGELSIVFEALSKSFEDVECEYKTDILLLHEQFIRNNSIANQISGSDSVQSNLARIVNAVFYLLEKVSKDNDFVAWFNRGRMNLRLITLDERVNDGDIYVFGEIVLGRDQDSDVVISDPTVTLQHAKITFKDRKAWVYDLGSTNGTFIDDNRIFDYASLYNGCILSIAQIQFRVEIDFGLYTPRIVTTLF